MHLKEFIHVLSISVRPLLTSRVPVLLAALTGSLAVALPSRRLDFGLAFTPQTGHAVLRYQGAAEASGLEKLGGRLLQRLPLLGTLFHLPQNRRWLALEGTTPSTAAVVGFGLLAAAAALAFVLFIAKPIALLLPPLAFCAPFLTLRSKAQQVQRRLERSLPEIAAILAAEMAAGLPPDQALARAAAWTGPMARLLQEVIEASRRTGRPVFGRGPGAGTLVRTMAAYELPALQAFASQVDTAARKGAAGPALMHALVQTYIVAYQDRALQQAEKLETRLSVPSVLFFFLPLLFLLLTPMLIPLLRIM